MINRALLLACGLLAGAVAIGGCGDDDEDSATGGTGGTGNTGNTGNDGGSGATGNTGGTGATGAAGQGGGGAGQGGTGGGPPAPTCAEYCATIATNCTGDNAQYSADPNCEAYCATWEAGADGDTMGNTVGCHAYHAAASAGDGAEMHCIHAGPGGGSMCGTTPCDDFCEAAVALCTGEFEVWADKGACMTDCMDYPTTVPYDASVAGGDQFACRLYHLTVASTTPDPHCGHIGPTPDPVDPNFPCKD